MLISKTKSWLFLTTHESIIHTLSDKWGSFLNFKVKVVNQFDNASHMDFDPDMLWIDYTCLQQMFMKQNVCVTKGIPLLGHMLDMKFTKPLLWAVIVDDDLTMEQLNALSCESHVLCIVHINDLQDTTKALQVLIHVRNDLNYISDIGWMDKLTHSIKHVHVINNTLTPIMLQLWNNKLNHVQLYLHNSLMGMITHMWTHMKTSVDAICVHANQLQTKTHTQALDRIKMMQVAGQLYHEHTQRSVPTVYVDVDANTDMQFIKLMLSVSELNGITQLSSNNFDVTQASVQAMIHSQFHVPAPIKQLLDVNKNIKKSVTTNKVNLTPREHQILHIICDKGHSNKMIANDLKLSESAVKLHIGNILKKYNVRNRTQLALYAQHHNSN